MLEIRLFGTFDIRDDGQPVIIPSRAARSLFAYLILNSGISHRREKLAGMFWPEATEARARSYLRYELWRIRNAFRPESKIDYLMADAINISFNGSTQYWLDVSTLKNIGETASVEELMATLAVYHGEMLPGFYDEWIVREREHFQAIYEQQMTRLLESLESERRWPEILNWAEHWISLGHTPESGHRALIVAYAALGDRAKVIMTYQRCVQALAELGLEPSKETRALAEMWNSLPNNIPIPMTSFIGRETELKEVLTLLSKFRLVTLTGSGGMGKTRLSIRVAEAVQETFPDGVWFLNLAPFSDPALIPDTLARVLGLREGGDSKLSVTDLLINYLSSRRALIIFDNCEHLIAACARLADMLLTACTDLSILATSRQALRVSGEARYRVASLEVPALSVEKKISVLGNAASVRLFVERAAVVLPGFAINPQNASDIVQICQRLDGIPLAIELAAARMNMLTTNQIMKRLDDRFNLLTRGLRSALPRHQTLRAAIEWGYGLLSEQERLLFRRLALFMGGWTLEAAEEVCGGNGIESSHVPYLLSQLINKSLVVVETSNGENRYRRLETIRQFAGEKLNESGEREQIGAQHLEYFLKLAQEAELELYSASQMEWLQKLEAEHENMRAALEWADKTDVEAGLCLCGSMHRFWESFVFREGNYWLSKFLQKPESHHYPRPRARALSTYGWILVSLQQSDVAQSLAKESLELYRSLGDQRGEVDGLLLLGWISPSRAQKMEFNQQALELAQSFGDVRRQASALWHLGWLYQGENRFVYWKKAIALTRSLGNLRGLAGSLSTTGFFLLLNGEIESAQKHLDESNRLYQQLNLNLPPTHLLSAYSQISLIRGDFKKARAYLEEAIRSNVEFGSRQGYLWARVRLGYVALREGNLSEAVLCFSETAKGFREDKYKVGAVYALEGIASLLVVADRHERGAQLIGWADASREKTSDMRPLLEQSDINQDITAIIAKIGNAAFEEAYNAGNLMTLDQAVAFALEELP
jgi:predicted ATPase/DNA-binding SARP family transcriptional activator